MKASLLASLIILIFFINACSEDPVSPDEDPIITQWHAFEIQQVDYDSLQIASINQMEVDDRSVEKIILMIQENDLFLPQDTIVPGYEENASNYYLNFHFNQKVSKFLLDYQFRLHYVLDTDSVITADSSHLMIHYPYQSAEIFLTADEAQPAGMIYFQDIALNDTSLFFHPTAALGLYEYNLTTKQTAELVGYEAGNYIAQDSIFVFYEFGAIFRYNLKTATSDLKIDLSALHFNGFLGMACWQNQLYVLFRAIPENFIGIFNFDGTYVRSIPYPGNTFYLAIDNGIAYSHDYRNNLRRFGLATGSFLTDFSMPINDAEGFRIYKDNFYFTGWGKRIIGVLPLSDLE